jgi:uroporphyrinogen decarboxylase
MYDVPEVFDQLLAKLVAVTAEYATEQVSAGADVIQVFDSWVGCLSPQDYRRYVLPRTRELVQRLKSTGAPVIYFGTDTSTLLPAMQETGANVIGLDWRIPLDQGRSQLRQDTAVQGNLDPVVLFSGWKQVEAAARDVMDRAGGRPGHIFNLGHGILPETPVENVKALVAFVHEYSQRSAVSQSV